MLPDRMLSYWDTEYNTISVEQAFRKSVRPAFWVDPVCGHRWEQRIGVLTTMFERLDAGLRKSVCPACEGYVTIPGKNDLLTTHPELESMWHPTNELKMSEVSKGSRTVVQWKCDKGHEWKSKIKDQAVRGFFCRKCDGKSSKGVPRRSTLLKDTHPDLFKELVSIEKIDDLDKVTSGSTRYGEWKCEEGHLYKAKVTNRTSLNRGCPFCAGRYAIPGENDIATTDPEVMIFWDYEKNTVKPEEVKRSTNKPLHWICSKNHRWEAVPINLTTRNQFCPFCSGKRFIPGETDFASMFPERLKYWNYEKNTVSPDSVSAGNRLSVFWKCDADHEWEASVFTQTTYSKDSTTSGCAICAGTIVLIGFNDLASRLPELLAEWDYEKNTNPPDTYTWGSGAPVWWKCVKEHQWRAPIYRRTGKNACGCPECGRSASKAEIAIAEFLTDLLPEETVLRNKRKIVKGHELDIYIPSKKVAVEYNGVYWHSEAAGKEQNYHYDKWLACKDKGIQLIQVWEDEWNRNPEQIKRMLAHKLGVSDERKVFARKTKIIELSKIEAEEFLNENHVQGYASGSYYLGLRDNEKDEVVALLVLKNEAGAGGKTLNIIRYATSANVVGGFTKLLKHSTRAYQPDFYITFSDHCVSDGGLYENNGFVADKELPPDYMYVVGNVRKHKFGYRISKFKTDPNLLWKEGLTERELADLNGLKRIWDAGKTRWVKAVISN